MTSIRRVSLTSIAVAIATVALCSAQQPTFKRTELQRGDLSAPGREAVMAIAEIPAGVASGKHTHPGEEVGYVLQGPVVIEVDGKSAMTYQTGDVFFIPAGRVHNARNSGGGGAKVLATYIIEKGKPVATPVP